MTLFNKCTLKITNPELNKEFWKKVNLHLASLQRLALGAQVLIGLAKILKLMYETNTPLKQFHPGVVPVEIIFLMVAPISMIIELKKKVPVCYYVSVSSFAIRLLHLAVTNMYFWQDIIDTNEVDIYRGMLLYIYLMFIC